MKSNTSKQRKWLLSLVLLPLLAITLYSFSSVKKVEREVIPKMLFENETDSKSNSDYTARSITIKIQEDGTYLVDDIKATKNSLASVVNELHQDISYEVRNKIMNIHVSSLKEISKEEVWFIYNSLFDYGFHRLVTDKQEVIRSKGNKPFAIQEELEKIKNLTFYYNIDKNEYYKNATFKFRDKNKNIISVKTYSELSEVEKSQLMNPPSVPLKKSPTNKLLSDWKNSSEFGIWIDGKRVNNNILNNYSSNDFSQYFVSKLAKNAVNYGKHFYQIDLLTNSYFDEKYKNGIKPLSKTAVIYITLQQSATRKQMTEYNALAKKYNAMSRDNFVVVMKEVERMKYIYGIMSDKQRKSAEPFPKFPPPPKAPKEPKEPKAPKVYEIREVPPPPPADASPKEIKKYKEAKEKYEYRVKKAAIREVAPPPPPPHENATQEERKKYEVAIANYKKTLEKKEKEKKKAKEAKLKKMKEKKMKEEKLKKAKQKN